jgi:hypothetical protein
MLVSFSATTHQFGAQASLPHLYLPVREWHSDLLTQRGVSMAEHMPLGSGQSCVGIYRKCLECVGN